ncbi:MAG: chromosomal replication initiator protein DnaA [Proteobacteria bacterium]|nr:chromosomal replication initiator protein DnaA [Pseudomonadota bacterium]
MHNSSSAAAVGPPTDLWEQTLQALETRIKPHNFEMWLRPIVCASVADGTLHLRAPNRYIKEWFEDNYLPIVRQELSTRFASDHDIEVSCDEAAPAVIPTAPRPAASVGAIPAPLAASAPAPFPPAADNDLNARYEFDSFVVGPSNQLAYAAARAVAELPAAKYNPLFIYGGVGLGKTHLLCAIGNAVLARQPAARVVYLSSERFMNDYINHLRSNRMEDFRTRYRDRCDLLLMDDIQFIAGNDRTQDEFFHTFNALHDLNRQIVVTSDKYPHEIPELEERLRTRFQWGLIADIQQPELETRVAILRKMAESERIVLADEVALYLAQHIKSNVRELEGSLIRLAAVASLQQVEISIPFAEQTLRQLLGARAASLTVETIQREVAAYFGLKLSELKGARRHRAVAWPRQVAMYLARKLTGCSYPELGQRFGGKDHSTVIAACRKVTKLTDTDLAVRTTLESLERQLGVT